MKSVFSMLFIAAALTLSAADDNSWKLVWEENFDNPVLNPEVWSKCARGKVDWANTMSSADSLFVIDNGILHLRGVVNGDTVSDPSPYLTGGIWTKNLKAFEPGKIEVRARLHAARGAWPAIWLLPFSSEQPWPYGGEVDIMERLNYDDFAYQTVHSHYTYDLGFKTDPKSGFTGKINPEDFNVYGVEIHPDSVVMLINGNVTGVYPKINDGENGQFPYYQPMFLLIDMQLGGSWVGEVSPDDLPVEMEIDWVRHYLPSR